MTITTKANNDTSIFLHLPYVIAQRQQRLQFVAIHDRHRSFVNAAFCFSPAVKLVVELFVPNARSPLATPKQC
jgi:hypothetical protein